MKNSKIFSENETEQQVTADLNTDFTKNRSTAVYHYEVPNLTSMLYEYTNKEQEYIGRCFRSGNYNNLRELPDNFVGCTLFNNDGSSKFAKGEQPHFKVHYKSKNGEEGQKDDSAKKFEYMSDNYEAFLESQKKDKITSKEKQKKVHGDKEFNTYKGKYFENLVI